MFPSRKRPRTSLGSASCWSSGDLRLPATSDEEDVLTTDGQSWADMPRVSRKVSRRKVVTGLDKNVSLQHSLFLNNQREAENEFHVANSNVEPSVSVEPAATTDENLSSSASVTVAVPSAEIGCSSSTNIVRGQASFQRTLQSRFYLIV